MDNDAPKTVLYQRNYDKEKQHQIEERFATLISSINGYCLSTRSAYIVDADAVARVISSITELSQWCRQLYLKYREDIKNIRKLDELLRGSLVIDALPLLDHLRNLQDEEIMLIAVKHKLMDRTLDKEPWENEVKKKFWLNDENWTQELENMLYRFNARWRRQVFLETAFMVLKHGDIVKMISGPNNSGKTWSAIPQVRFANWLLRNFWIKYLKSLPVPPEEDKKARGAYNQRLSTIARLETVKPFKFKNNIIFYPEPERVRAKIADGSSFNCIDVNEGMKSAINLRSFDQEALDMILELFTERASNNYLIYEYQQAKRPPKLLLGRFNVWQNKMGPKWMVVSIPSALYRTEDPFYMGEVEKIKGDRRVSNWFTHKSGNVNFIAKMKAPKITETDDIRFKKLRKLAKEEYEKGRSIKKKLGTEWYLKIEDVWKQVHSGDLSYLSIPNLLKEQNSFSNDQITKFMRDYDGYDRLWKLQNPQIAKEVEA